MYLAYTSLSNKVNKYPINNHEFNNNWIILVMAKLG